jgi:hypothetical protein
LDSCGRLEAETAARGEQLAQLQAELARSAEELEQSENCQSDLKETLGHVQERRNSLGKFQPIFFSLGTVYIKKNDKPS